MHRRRESLRNFMAQNHRQYREYDHQYDDIPVLATTDPSSSTQTTSAYPTYSTRQPFHGPLIDLVTNEWQKRIPKEKRHKPSTPSEPPPSAPLAGRYKRPSDSDYDSDSEDNYSTMGYDTYGIEDFDPEHPCADLLYPLPLLASRRYRHQFYWVLIVLAVVYLLYWWFFRPVIEERRAVALSFKERTDRWGENKRPAFGGNEALRFKGIKMVEELEEGKRLRGTKGLEEGRGVERLVLVGDVHGCNDDLSALLTKIAFNPGTDHLIFVGDLITKGPESSAVLSTAMSLSASSVRGNHEDRVLVSLDHLNSHPSSPSASENKHTKLARELPQSQIEFIQTLPIVLDVGEIPGLGRVLVVHAGLVPGVPLKRQDPFMCMNMRSIDLSTHVPSELHAAPGRRNTNGGLVDWERMWRYYERKVLPARLKQEDKAEYAETRKKKPKGEEWEGHTTVIYGHDSKRGLNLREWTKGLDSGCVNGGSLTAFVIEAVRKDDKGKERARTWTESVDCEGRKAKGKKEEEVGDREISSATQAWNPPKTYVGWG
ncbi:MAG: hypothetical protein M1820_006919 [Bogoriella megaspora]|nr:MAG: hypothetical protein M1820_006919 [Bogoriella megaspora]